MKKLYLLLTISTFVVIFFHAHATAIVSNPDPTVWGNDVGTELWTPNAVIFKSSYSDLLGSLGYPSVSGFYFESFPNELIQIFGTEDQPPPQNAAVLFNDGIVVDLDTMEVQSAFLNRGTNIGFFFAFQTDPNAGPIFLFTQSSLNGPLGDRVSAFPALDDPSTFLLVFDSEGTPIDVEFISGLTPVSPVPEPSTLLLLGSGLTGFAGFCSKRFWKNR